MRAAAIVGWKNSGKTTLCSQVAGILTQRGHRVGVLKSSHHGFDLSGSDTERLSRSAAVVGGVGPEQCMLIWSKPKHILDLIPLMEVDILLLEGGKSMEWLPRILVARTVDEARGLQPELALGSWGEVEVPGLNRLRSAEEIADLVLEKGFALPGLDCGQCGFPGCKEMSMEIVAGRASLEDCQALGTDLSIRISGREVAMNGFVRSLIAGAITGMLGPLKGIRPGRATIELDFEPVRTQKE